MIASLVWTLAMLKIDAATVVTCAEYHPPPSHFITASRLDTAVSEVEAGHLADQYVKEQGFNWGQYSSVQRIPSGYAVEYATPERERQMIGPRQIVVSSDGKSIALRKGRR